MVVRNKNLVAGATAKIVFEGKEKEFFKRKELEELEGRIEKISDEQKKNEAYMAFDYLLNESKIVLTPKGDICLFTKRSYRKIEPLWFIRDNPELFALLEQLVQS